MIKDGIDLFFVVAIIFVIGFVVALCTGYMDTLVEKSEHLDQKADQNKHE